ncbi:hypothetical protein BV22DRAFT_208125 [Leucogyrophana mollusca]|uniref:Uncharacterized protein n=1 Tax=Leucogyrophana mollusca TaxID=85980 RepID=A0ACB8BR55_9AGAM|nr:hypothetical protein BV22DRAFT_208125 [Leucogyrophana mollusca]
MQYRDHGSDSSYDIVPVPRGTVDTSRHRPPPAPTTVQVDDDFDAITADDGFGTVYGEWAETHEVHHHQENRGYTDSQNEYGRYTNEVEQIFGSDINLEVTRGGRSAGGEAKDNSFSSPMMRNRETNVSQSPLKRGGSMSRSSGEPLQHRGSARGAKVTMWREEVARNEESEYGSDQHDRGAEVFHPSGHFQRPRDRTYESGTRGGGSVPVQPGESGQIGDSRMKGLSSRRPGEIEVSVAQDIELLGLTG